MTFRQDINGLRAISVLAVVLFHFGFSAFGGGFVGVDVFFVISGYLMTRILVSRLEAGRLRVMDFYLDRARRIVPALAALCAILLLLGWFYLPSIDYRELGREAVSALLFVSNMLFYSQTGYFDASSQEKWFLHTWSLSVEWQFYLLYPFIIIALFRVLPRPAVRWAIMGLAVAGYVAAMLVARSDLNAAFYLFPTRAWEMLAGAIIFFFPLQLKSQSLQRAIEWTGIAILLVFIALTDHDTPWPTWAAAIPILATMVVMLPARAESHVLGNPVIAWIGKTSYSTYIWHWPLVVALTMAGLMGSLAWQVGGVILSLLLGSLSYVAIEQPTSGIGRGAARGKRPWYLELAAHWPVLVIVLPVLFASVVIWRLNGVQARMPVIAQVAERSAQPDMTLRTTCFDLGNPADFCHVGGKNKPVQAILFGDSHALAVAPAVHKALVDPSRASVLFRAFPGCPTVAGAGLPTLPGCSRFNDAALRLLESDSYAGVPAVIVNSWRAYIVKPEQMTLRHGGRRIAGTRATYVQQAKTTLCAIAAKRPLVVMLGYPDWDFNVPATMTRRLMIDTMSPDIVQTLDAHLERHAQERAVLAPIARECGFTLVDPAPYLCQSGFCPGTKGSKPLYYDPYHLNDAGTDLLVPMFRQVAALHGGPVPAVRAAAQ